MPGYTHLQRSSTNHFCPLAAVAYVEMFDRDYSRLTDAYNRMNTCPLGSGALVGTAYAVDRDSACARSWFCFRN